jgi:hypothetical protein
MQFSPLDQFVPRRCRPGTNCPQLCARVDNSFCAQRGFRTRVCGVRLTNNSHKKGLSIILCSLWYIFAVNMPILTINMKRHLVFHLVKRPLSFRSHSSISLLDDLQPKFVNAFSISRFEKEIGMFEIMTFMDLISCPSFPLTRNGLSS